jgi:PhnB protein
VYQDVAGALDWLSSAFGFSGRLRFAGPDGRASHAEMEIDDGVIMLGGPGKDYRNPKRPGGVTQLVHVYVDDVDDHFERAKEAGATIVNEPEDQSYGDRYIAEDLEGHRRTFSQHVRDVAPDQW